MRKMLLAAGAVLSLHIAAVFAQDAPWVRVQLENGDHVCVNAAYGESLFDPTYDSPSFTTVSCNVANQFTAWLAALWGVSVAEAQTVINAGRFTATPSGNIDSRYPDGNDGSAAIPYVWSTIPSFANKIEGTDTVSVDLCATYLTEPNTSTLTNIGAAFPTGWSLSGTRNCTLSYNSTGTGSAVVRIRATDDMTAETLDSNSFTVESVAAADPPGTDTTAPTIPTGLDVAMNSSSPPRPVVSFDPPTDVRVSGEDVSGLSTFTVSRGGTPLTPTAFTGTAIVPTYTADVVGTASNTSAVQTGANWTLTAEGGHPLDGSNLLFLNTPVTGDFICTVKVTGFSGASTAAARGMAVMVREGLAAGARQVAGMYFAGSNNIRGYPRTVTDGTITTSGLYNPGAPPVWLRWTRTGNFFLIETSTSGNGLYEEVWSGTVGLTSSVRTGVAVQSDDEGVAAVTVNIENLSCNTLPRQTFTDTGGTYEDSYTVLATDTEGNASAASVAMSAPAAPGTGSEGNILIGWDHSLEEIGELIHSTEERDYPAPWGGGTLWRVNAPGTQTRMYIEDTSPLCPSCGKYMRTWAMKDSGNAYRSERLQLYNPPNREDMILLNGEVGNGNWRAQDTYWYGFLWQLVQYPPNQENVHLHQFWTDHAPPPADQTNNPQMSLFFNAEQLRVYIEANDDRNAIAAAQGGTVDGRNYFSNPIDTNIVGKCYRFIWQIYADTRTAAEGSTGIARLWVDSAAGQSATPDFEYTNMQVMQDDMAGKQVMFTWGTYLSAWRWSPASEDGQVHEAKMDNFVLMDGTGSYSAMANAVGSCGSW